MTLTLLPLGVGSTQRQHFTWQARASKGTRSEDKKKNECTVPYLHLYASLPLFVTSLLCLRQLLLLGSLIRGCRNV